jgi:hypothetical protein
MSLLTIAGCSDGSAAVPARHDQSSRELTGAWNVTLVLEQAYPLSFQNPPARRLCGTMSFVDREKMPKGDGRERSGVYSLDLARLGLDWLNDNSFPAAIARESPSEAGEGSDSVLVTLNPGSRENIVLRGVYRSGGIDGRWTAQSARGTASGVFTLLPHVPGTDAPNC